MTPKPARILVVGSDADMASSVASVLREARHAALVETADTDVLDVVERERLDAIVADLRAPPIGGLALLATLTATHPEIAVVALTGLASVDIAVSAMQGGATDCLAHPFAPEELLLRVERAIAQRRAAGAGRSGREGDASTQAPDTIVGRSAALAELMRVADKVAATDTRVLIVGEPGTGKRLIARTIHRRSIRRAHGYFTVECGALPEDLLECTLFGDERGAVIGTVGAKNGIFETARGGTLLLGDVETTSLAFQRKLLRVLQLGESFCVGGRTSFHGDVRILSSTSSDLRTAVGEGRFSSRLFYRLSVVQIHVPPLRDRTDDIPLLAAHFVRIHSMRMQKRVRGISAEAMETLMRHSWPGNIRELENVIQAAVVAVRDGQQISREHWRL